MPFHPLYVPKDHNQFFAAFSLSLLVPVLDDDVLLDEVLEKLFGRSSGVAMANLVNDLRAYIPRPSSCSWYDQSPFCKSSLDKSLAKVIDTYLRPRLANYILANKEEYLALLRSEAALLEAVEDMRRSSTRLLSALEERALPRMMGMNLYLHRSAVDPIPFKAYEHGGEEAREAIRLISWDGVVPSYHAFIATERLSYKRRRHFFPESIRDTRVIMGDIDALCQRHIDVTRDEEKLKIIKALKAIRTQEGVLKQLDLPCGIKGYESWSNKVFLLRPNMHWGLQLLIAAVVIVTFPLSIPLWLFYSWAQDRWDAIATRDRIFVRKLTALCQEKVAPEIVEAERVLEGERALEAARQRQALGTVALPRPMIEDGLTTSDVRVAASPGQTSREPGAQDPGAAPVVAGDGEGGDSFDDINHHLAIGMERLLLMMVDGMYRKETGRPMVTTYRINRENPPEPGMFSIDIKVQFRWTSQPPMRAQLKLLKAFSPPPVDHLAPFVSPEAPPPTRMETMQRSMPFFFKPKPDFEALLKQVDIDVGVKKQWTADAALKLPHTVSQRMALVVKMINYHDDSSKTEISLLPRRTPSAVAGVEIRTKRAIDSWLAKLPPNYQELSPEADAIAATYQSIIEHLQAGKVDEAWELFQPVSDVSPFICYAFSHLKAMEYQLAAVFIITWHKQWNDWLRISESKTIGETLNFLNLACKTVAPYNPAQKELIERLARTPLLQLIEAGKVAESRTSQEERVRISEERSNRVEGPMRGWGDLTFRDPFDNIDAGDTLPPPPPPSPPGAATVDAPRSLSPRL